MNLHLSVANGPTPTHAGGQGVPAPASARRPSAPINRMLMAGIAIALVYQVVLLILAGWKDRYVLNPDAVSYIRIASYYANGQFDLAVSGYWGPLLSWLIAPLLGVVENPLYAARIVMGLSGVIFLLGCISIFRSMELHPAGILLGTWIAAVMSAAWSVAAITPDLLMSGLLCMAISQMISRRWTQSPFRQLTAGLLFGVAYLTKAVAFPIALLAGGAIAAMWVIGQISNRTNVMRSLLITLLSFLLVAIVWTITLSTKYKSLVFTTSGRINHAIVGPPDKERNHPSFSIFHQPEPARITSWEDPTHMPYQYWSPLENLDYARHQLILIYRNAEAMLNHLSGFASLHLGLLAVFTALCVNTPWRRNMGADRWRWAGVIVACTTVIYLPVYAFNQRYYFAAYPFLFAASAGMVTWLTSETRQGRNWPRLIGLAAVTLCFALPARSALQQAFIGTIEKQRAVYTADLAKRLKAAGVQGTLAGGKSDGLYVAFFTDQPWYGHELYPTAEKFKAAGAKLALVHRDEEALISELNQDAAFVNLDSLLFANKAEADKFPLMVYQILHH